MTLRCSNQTVRPPIDVCGSTVSRVEVLVYHAVGNYMTRCQAGRDLKGTGAIIAAIDRLREEGAPIRLVFATDDRWSQFWRGAGALQKRSAHP